MSKHNKGNGIYFETESTTGWILNKEFIPTGRIKRMRKGKPKCNCYATYWMHKHKILRRIHGTSIVIPRNDPNFYEQMLHKITRWNRH